MPKKKASTNMGMFDQEKYAPITTSRGDSLSKLSPATTDGLANHAEAVISFFHVPSESDIFFKAFITTYAESYASDWNSETVFGRTDPIYTFKNTQRRLTVAWKIPADTIGEAYENLARVQKLAQFLYPNYAQLNALQNDDTLTLTQSPLVRLKVMNLARQTWLTANTGEAHLQTGPGGSVGGARAIFQGYSSTNDPSRGQLGVITNMNVMHNLENRDIGVFQVAQNTILPKMIEISIDFACIHESTLGWGEADNFLQDGFPYGAVSEVTEGVDDATSYSAKLAARRAAETQRQERLQEKQDAIARGYNGMFGKRRLMKDYKQLDKMRNRIGTEDEKKHDAANYEYLSSALNGHLRTGGDATSDDWQMLVDYESGLE